MKLLYVDFETEAIGPRPYRYPPKPVGLALKLPGHDGHYNAWGHATGNNARKPVVAAHLKKLLRTATPVYHNAQFDLEVADSHLGIKIPRSFHCTMILAFLHNPHEPRFDLKNLAEKYCNYPAVARDELKDWILKNIPAARAKKSTWGAYISQAPGDLVGKYAAADVGMTEALFNFLHAKVVKDMGMGEAYQRELDMVPLTLKIEQQGVHVDVDGLKKLIPELEASLAATDKKIRLRLKAPKLDIDKKTDLAAALQNANKIDPDAWPLTKKGLDMLGAGLLTADNQDDYRSTSHKLLKKALNDKFLWHLLFVRGKLATSLRTFARSWHDNNHDGKIYINWSSTRRDRNDNDSGGARTGRFASSPNMQNISVGANTRQFSPIEGESKKLAKDRQVLYDLYNLTPNLRKYIIPGKDKAFAIRDWSGQEMRIAAHFEDGPLLDAYTVNPKLDVHSLAGQLIYEASGLDYRAKHLRLPLKTINFGRLYGMGKGKLADQADIPEEDAGRLIKAHKLAFPGLTKLDNELKRIGLDGGSIKTLGGRRYFAEEPKFVTTNKITGAGRWWRFEYKLLNYLIQGSAADALKMVMLELSRRGLTLALTVHDEIIICENTANIEDAMRELQEVMETFVPLDVPLLSEGAICYNNWGQMVK